MFIDRMVKAVKEKNNPSVVGLDSKLEYVPDFIVKPCFEAYGGFEGAARAVLEFNKLVIDAICETVAVVKPQIAYYEMYGVPGLEAFAETVEYAKARGLIVIGDCKRNDIGSTAECYAKAFLGRTVVGGKEYEAFPVDALTVNPYLGYDGIKPFSDACVKYGKGIFVLVKTSNPSSAEFQDVMAASGEKMFELVAKNIATLAESIVHKCGYSPIGIVAGATYPDVAKKLRKLLPRSYFLVPGYGAQGGKAADIATFFNPDGLGAIISSSREILLAYKNEYSPQTVTKDELIDATRVAAIKMRDDINCALKN